MTDTTITTITAELAAELAAAATDPDSPWYGIPAELLGEYSYDLDTAGGCG